MATRLKDRVEPDYRDSSAPAYQQVIAGDPRPAPPLFTEYAESDVPVRRVPRAQYTDPAFAALERERMWSRVWQMACREEQIPEAGDCLLYEAPGASLIIVRTDDDTIKAYYNSCLHRGMKLCATDTSVTKLTCPFHGFSWNLDGSLAHVPSRWDFPQVEEADLHLKEAKVGRWGGFVFVNLDPQAGPLEDYLGHLVPHFADWPRDQVYLSTILRKTMDANWKTCIEAFLEAFHVPHIHAQALPFGGDSSTQYDVWPDDPHVSRFLEPVGVPGDQYAGVLSEQEILDAALRAVSGAADVPQLPEGVKARHFMAEGARLQMGQADGRDYAHLSDTEATDAMQYSLFPNFILFRSLLYPYAYRFLPVKGDPGRTTFDFMFFRPKPTDGSALPEVKVIDLDPGKSYADAGVLPRWHGEIYDQDVVGLAQCQDGLQGGGDGDVIYSRYQEVRLRHLHQTLATYLDLDEQGRPRA